MSRVVAFIVYDVLAGNEKFQYLPAAIIYYVGWLFWDVIPLTFVMRYHSKKVKMRETITVPDTFFETEGSTNDNENSPPPLAFPEEDEVMFLGNPEYTELLLQN